MGVGALPADTCLHGSAELLAYSLIPSRRQADPPTHAPLLCTLCCAGHPLVRFMGMSSTGNSDPSLAYVQNLKAVDGDCNSCAFVPAVDNTATFELNLVRVWGEGARVGCKARGPGRWRDLVLRESARCAACAVLTISAHPTLRTPLRPPCRSL